MSTTTKIFDSMRGKREKTPIRSSLEPVMDNATRTITLFGWIFDTPDEIFVVDIEKDKSVSHLKQAIVRENGEINVHPPRIKVWHLIEERPVEDIYTFLDDLRLRPNDLPKLATDLHPVSLLSDVFLEGQAKPSHLHIVVELPETAISKPENSSKPDTIDESSKRLTFAQLEQSQVNLIQEALKAPSPPSAAILNAYLIEQEKRPIWNGRPFENRGIPIQLYHPSFGKFLKAVRDKDVPIDLKPQDYAAAESLFHHSATLYKDEARRTQAIRAFLNKAIHHHISSLDIPGLKVDGSVEVDCGDLFAAAVLEEEKNEVATGGCDPTHQCGLDFRLYYAMEHELTDFVWIGGHPCNDDKLKSVTRILAALGEGITELEDFYGQLPHRQDPQRFFPFIRHYSSGERIFNFSYKAYLFRKTPESPSKPIFLATIECDSEQEARRDIVVKFVQIYNAEAHRLLAVAGYAPELLYCSKDDPNSEDLGGLIMVVMAYVNGKTAHERYGRNPLPQAVFDKVEKAMEILHAGNFVFADLRPPNIMVTEDERVMLVDFDWCGVHKEGTYPISLNDDREFNSIDWHPDVKRGGRMLKEHDIYLLRRMKR